jgi:hypothetical protein
MRIRIHNTAFSMCLGSEHFLCEFRKTHELLHAAILLAPLLLMLVLLLASLYCIYGILAIAGLPSAADVFDVPIISSAVV